MRSAWPRWLEVLGARVHTARHVLGFVRREVVGQKVGSEFYLAMRCIQCGRTEEAKLDAQWDSATGGAAFGVTLFRPRIPVDVVSLPRAWRRG